MEEKRKFEGELKPKEFKNQNETKDTIKRRGKLEFEFFFWLANI